MPAPRGGTPRHGLSICSCVRMSARVSRLTVCRASSAIRCARPAGFDRAETRPALREAVAAASSSTVAFCQHPTLPAGDARPLGAARRPLLEFYATRFRQYDHVLEDAITPAVHLLQATSRVVVVAVGSPKFLSGERSMAIKRPTKSRGTPSRKPVASVAVRHVDLWSKSQMVPGNLYVGWLCKNRSCGALIAIALPPAGSKVAMPEFDDQLTALKCPHCGDEDLYRWSARSEQKYSARSGST